MNLNALKNFAPNVRRQLIEAVGRKLDFVLTGDTPDLREKAKQRMSIKGKAEKDRPGLIERVAYTWFNRLAALRFLDARGWHPFLCRVITPANEGETQPEILKLTRNGALPAELGPFTDSVRINDLLDGRIPSADPQGEVYRHLVLAACRYYHNLMPFLFEALDDETELLLPDDLLTEHSVAQGFRSAINDDDCAEVEIIGWLYEFYIAEKKDQVRARKSAVPTEDIPAATQLFTPHWIVRYLVENSLGRLWMLNRPNSRLAEKMDYYIKAETQETDFLKISKPEDIKACDPASGSGHMLVYAFDILYFIYEEEGYEAANIPRLILENNLYGIEIDERAGELAAFALTMKARQYDKRFFSRIAAEGKPIEPNICVLQNISFEAGELKTYMDKVGRDLFTMNLQTLLHQFEEADNFGSLIRPAVTNVTEILRILEEKKVADDLFLHSTHERVLMALKQADYLRPKYHVVIANPPYMGGKVMNRRLGAWVKDNYPDNKSDLFAAFIVRCLELVKTPGFTGFMTPFVWMFLSSYEKLRNLILEKNTLVSLVKPSYTAFFDSAIVAVCAFIIHRKHNENIKGSFFDLEYLGPAEEQSPRFLRIKGSQTFYRASAADFKKIPGSPIAYWASENVRDAFKGDPIGDILTFKQGMATSDNDRFIKYWHEVETLNTDFSCVSPGDLKKSKAKWFPYNKGGSFRKWFGNNELLVNWENDGQEMRDFTATLSQGTFVRLKSREYYCLPCITYSALSSSDFGCRISDSGFLFDTKGSCIFGEQQNLKIFSGLLNSKVAKIFLNILCPTLDYSMIGVKQVPVVKSKLFHNEVVVDHSVCISRQDWDSYETSWGFTSLPLLHPEYRQPTLKATYTQIRTHWQAMTHEMQRLEEENNSIFIEAYGLQEELTPDVPLNEITLTCNPHHRYSDNKSEIQLECLLLADTVKKFISYAVGCTFGRYSLDRPGLILSDAGDTLENYLAKVGRPLAQITFAPDEDGITPVLDGEWFEDDIVARTRDFLRATFGEASLEENLRFIEESLGKDLHKYFLTDFYKDHILTYKKRPIYWLFQSPKKGFSALIYLHRYTRDTVNVLLNSYLRDYLHKIRSRIEHLEHVQATSENSREKTAARKESDALKKTLHECEEYERDIILPLAQQRIELDLDDGVKVNYLKFGKALATIPGLAAKEEDG